MDTHPALFFKTLVVGVIVLFIVVGIQPAFADVFNSSVSENETSLIPDLKILGIVSYYDIAYRYILFRPLIVCKYADYDGDFTVKGKIFKWNSINPICSVKHKYYRMKKWETFFGIGLDEYDLPYLYPNIYRITFTIVPNGIEVNKLNNIRSKHYFLFENSYHNIVNVRAFVNMFWALGI
ncbi:hypothetical protein AYK21_03400 [Thermoplasmatales archaeon SG8-52-2]|nr:MAG: hypothetical protein AYK21_03400 [Thermoplasmatales archaeon SG8-52-2]